MNTRSLVYVVTCLFFAFSELVIGREMPDMAENTAIVLGVVTKCEKGKAAYIGDFWKMEVSHFRNVLGDCSEKEIEVSFDTTPGGLVSLLASNISPTNWIGKTILVKGYRRDRKYVVPSPRGHAGSNFLSPDGKPLHVFSDSDQTLIDVTSRVMTVLALEKNAELIAGLATVAEDATMPLHLRSYAAETMVYVSRWAKENQDALFAAAIKRLTQWRDNDRMPTEIRFYADETIAGETYGRSLESTIEQLWEPGRLRFLSKLKDAADMPAEVRQKARERLEEAERTREDFKAGRWKPPPEI